MTGSILLRQFLGSAVLHGQTGVVDTIDISQDNHWLVTAGFYEPALLWDLNAKLPAANSVVLSQQVERSDGYESGQSLAGHSKL